MVRNGGINQDRFGGTSFLGGGRKRSIFRRGRRIPVPLTWARIEQGQTLGPGIRKDLKGNLYVNDTEDQGDTDEHGACWDAARWPDSEPEDDEEDASPFVSDSDDVSIQIGESFVPEMEYKEKLEVEAQEAVMMEDPVAKVDEEEFVMEERVVKVKQEEDVMMGATSVEEVIVEQVGMVDRPVTKLEHSAAMQE